MKKTVFLFGILFLLAGQFAYAAEQGKIGIVDLLKALNESGAGKKAKVELEGFIKSKQAGIDEKGKEIEKLKGEMEKQSSVLSAEARKSREEELERLLREYQRMVSDAQNDIKKREGEFTGSIIKEIRVIIEKMGQDEGYTLIFEKADGLVLYSKQELDLTDVVIKKYNALKEGKK
jgi:outer membrane protein